MKKQQVNSGQKMIIYLLVLTLFAGYTLLNSQTLNPPYPRLGIFTFSGQTEACAEILKDFDIIAAPKNSNVGRLCKERNPDCILLETSGHLADWSRFSIQWPEEWYYWDENGEKFDASGRNLGLYIMNITKLCQQVDIGEGGGPETWVEHEVQSLEDYLDPAYFDGFFYDWWWPYAGGHLKYHGDLDRNGIADAEEWGVDSVVTLWWQGLLDFHEKVYQIPGVKIQVVQVGPPEIYPYVNGSCWEDWPFYIGPFEPWRYKYNDAKIQTREPKINIMDAAHGYYNFSYPVQPYKNNYKAIRFALGSCLLTSAYFYVDEGNYIGHHGNVHIYDEFEGKGQLGYPRTDMISMPGKTLAQTNYASGVWIRFFDNGVSLVNATGLDQTITASELSVLDPVGGSKYYRFLGGQDPVFNNGNEVTEQDPLILWGDMRVTNMPYPEVFGDGTMLFRSKKTLITPIVVDNNENNQTSPGSDPVQYQGGWILDSSGEKFYAFYTVRNYGPFQPYGFAWSPPGSGENVATYVPTIGVPGMYEVFEWHGYRGTAPGSYQQASDAAFQVNYGTTRDTTITVDQTRDYGQWNSLGVYFLPKGTGSNVQISNAANGIIISDAISFVYRSPSDQYDSTAPLPPENVKVIQLD